MGLNKDSFIPLKKKNILKPLVVPLSPSFLEVMISCGTLSLPLPEVMKVPPPSPHPHLPF